MPPVLSPRAQLGPRAASPSTETLTLPQKGPTAGPGLGWQLAQQNDNEKVLKRRSLCASIKKRKQILTLQLYFPSITDKIPSDLLQLHKTQLLL